MTVKEMVQVLLIHGRIINDSETATQRTTTIMLDHDVYFVFWKPTLKIVTLGCPQTWQDKDVQVARQ